MTCFGILIKIMVITHRCFQLLYGSVYRVRDISTSHAAQPVRWLRVHKELRENTVRTADSGWRRNIPYHMVLCSAGVKEEERGGSQRDSICLHKKPLRMMTLLSWKCLNICLMMGSSKQIPCFALLMHAAFALPGTLSLFPTHEVSHFCLIFFPIPPGRVSKQLWGTQLHAKVKPQQQRKIVWYQIAC